MKNKLLEWFGVFTAIMYSMMVALNIGFEFIGFLLLLISALSIGYWSYLGRHRGILFLQFFYATAGIIGMIRWYWFFDYLKILYRPPCGFEREDSSFKIKIDPSFETATSRILPNIPSIKMLSLSGNPISLIEMEYSLLNFNEPTKRFPLSSENIILLLPSKG